MEGILKNQSGKRKGQGKKGKEKYDKEKLLNKMVEINLNILMTKQTD